MPVNVPGTLKVLFVYADAIHAQPQVIQELCPQPAAAEMTGVAAAAANIALGVAVKAVESVLDAVAAKADAELTTLQATYPLEGFFDERGALAVAGGYLVFHNADRDDLSDATLLGAFRLTPSFDRSAFRFTVQHWRFTRFLREQSSRWFQSSATRDLVLKIELLSPGSAGLGTSAVFVEQSFSGVDAATLATAFSAGQQLAWFAVPPPPAAVQDPATPGPPGKYLPLNVQVTLVETTKPNRIARWLRTMAEEKKADVSLAVKDALQKALEQGKPVTNARQPAESAAEAYKTYKNSWDAAVKELASQHVAPPGVPSTDQQAETAASRARLAVKIRLVTVDQSLARDAFAAAGLAWPGTLPALV